MTAPSYTTFKCCVLSNFKSRGRLTLTNFCGLFKILDSKWLPKQKLKKRSLHYERDYSSKVTFLWHRTVALLDMKIFTQNEGTATESFSPLGWIVFSKLWKDLMGEGLHLPPPSRLVRPKVKTCMIWVQWLNAKWEWLMRTLLLSCLFGTDQGK